MRSAAAALAVELGHRRLGVAGAGHGLAGNGAGDLLELDRSEREVGGPERLVQPLAGAGADERDDVLAAGEDPGDGAGARAPHAPSEPRVRWMTHRPRGLQMVAD